MVCNEEVVNRLLLDKATKVFLCEFGLPVIKDVLPYSYINFYIPEKFEIIDIAGYQFIIVGEMNNNATKLFISFLGNGRLQIPPNS